MRASLSNVKPPSSHLTVRQAAERLGLSVPSIYRLADALQAVRVGKRGLRFTEDAVAAYAAEQEQARQQYNSGRPGPTDAQRQEWQARGAMAAGNVFARSKHGKVILMNTSRIGKTKDRIPGSPELRQMKRLWGKLTEADRQRFLFWADEGVLSSLST
jgi:excisionase family DNA binding protein